MKLAATLLLCLWALSIHAQNIGIDIINPKEKLDVNGAVKIGMTDSTTQGALRFNGWDFEGNVDGTTLGWRSLTGHSHWTLFPFDHLSYDPLGSQGSVSIGDTVFNQSKLYVSEYGLGGTAIKGVFVNAGEIVASEGYLGHQLRNAPYTFNMGVFGLVNDDGAVNPASYGVVGLNYDTDTVNYGGVFTAQGFGGHRNIGVHGFAQNAPLNWAAYFDGRTTITEKLTVNTDTIYEYAQVQVDMPVSGNFPHIRIASPSDDKGYGLMFTNPTHQFYVGQNIGNWNDGRFQIAPSGSSHWLTILPNGNVGLTKTGFTTPFARLQVPENGNLDNGTLDLTQAALFLGYNMNSGMAFDHDQIETVGGDLHLNSNSSEDILLADGGGRVGVDADSLIADFHVGEYQTVLFGKDTVGKSNFYSDAKFMWKPGRGGAIRIGQLNADGSIIGGTGYDFWDHNNIGWASIAIGNNTRALGAGSVALGIRADARNFGSVALGHLSRSIGNSGVAAGYYTRADAFVSCAVGAGNVGGGSSNTWVATDPIFEVGNSIDTTNRSNALTVMKNARVGINHSNPQSMLDIEQPNQGVGNGVLLNLSGIGHWETGVDNAADYNFYFNNVLKAYIQDTDGSYTQTSDRRLKRDIERMGVVLHKVMQLEPSTYRYTDADPDTRRSYGLIAQDVLPLFPELVSEKDGFLGIAYGPVSIIAIQAIQEQQVMIDQQQEAIDRLQEQVEELMDVVAEMRRTEAK